MEEKRLQWWAFGRVLALWQLALLVTTAQSKVVCRGDDALTGPDNLRSQGNRKKESANKAGKSVTKVR